LFIESMFLASRFLTYLGGASLFSIKLTALPGLAALTLLSAYTLSLSSPAWEGWKKYLIAPAPIAIGVYAVLLNLEPVNALITCLIIFLIMGIYLKKSLKLEKLLVKSIPCVSLRPVIKGYLLCIALMASSVVLLNPENKKISVWDNIIDSTIGSVRKIIGGESNLYGIIGQGFIEDQVEKELTTRVKKAIEPYRNLSSIVMAVFVFVTMQGFNTIVYLIYSLTITPIFWLMKKIKFIVSDSVTIEKDHLHF